MYPALHIHEHLATVKLRTSSSSNTKNLERIANNGYGQDKVWLTCTIANFVSTLINKVCTEMDRITEIPEFALVDHDLALSVENISSRHAEHYVLRIESGLSSQVSLLQNEVNPVWTILPDFHPGCLNQISQWKILLCNSSLGTMVDSVSMSHLITDYEPQGEGAAQTPIWAEHTWYIQRNRFLQITLDDTASFPSVPDVDDNELAPIPWSCGPIEPGNLFIHSGEIVINFPVTSETWRVLRCQFPLVTVNPKEWSVKLGVCSRKDRWGAWKL